MLSLIWACALQPHRSLQNIAPSEFIMIVYIMTREPHINRRLAAMHDAKLDLISLPHSFALTLSFSFSFPLPSSSVSQMLLIRFAAILQCDYLIVTLISCLSFATVFIIFHRNFI